MTLAIFLDLNQIAHKLCNQLVHMYRVCSYLELDFGKVLLVGLNGGRL